MCGRFQLSVKGKEISERFNVEVHDELHRPDPKLPLNFKGFNCAPFQYLPVITNDEPRKLEYFRWGLLPQWAKDERIAAKMINARSETVMDKPAFKTAFERKRCLIPANGFYEWNKNKVKQAYRFYMRDESLLLWPDCGNAGKALMVNGCLRSPSSPPGPTPCCRTFTTGCRLFCQPTMKINGCITMI